MSEGQTTATLIAFPAAGGGAWMFARLRRALPSHVELVVPDLPGRGRRAGPGQAESFAELVGQLCDELGERVVRHPYVVFGSCFGSLLSFELLREIRRRRLPLPRAFMVSAREPPDTAPSYSRYLSREDGELRDYLQRNHPVDRSDKPAAQLQDLLIGYLRRDVAIAAPYQYTAEEPLPVPIFAYHGTDDPEVPPDGLEEWRTHTTQEFTLRLVPGERDFYLSDTRQLLADLTEVLS
ncbi:thioesterase II family protein [Microbispora sp. H10670]|uniref:thioesterase II family protein n=1 Tax=Microbispora sp. H10670 TaxID=2729108 RepID=UPI001601E689|nr:alpha/beta fold hydrolase [Microbispora sp. H10670]